MNGYARKSDAMVVEPSKGTKRWVAWLNGPPRRLQRELAAELGVSQQTVSGWSRGLIPSLENRLRIFRLTGIDPGLWLDEAARKTEADLLDQVKRKRRGAGHPKAA